MSDFDIAGKVGAICWYSGFWQIWPFDVFSGGGGSGSGDFVTFFCDLDQCDVKCLVRLR